VPHTSGPLPTLSVRCTLRAPRNRALVLLSSPRRTSTAKGYRDIWKDHLRPLCALVWLKDTRTYHVQSWLNQIGAGELSRNTLKHVKSVVSGVFTLAKQQDYFQGENPARDSAVNPKSAEPSVDSDQAADPSQSPTQILQSPPPSTVWRLGRREKSRGPLRALSTEVRPVHAPNSGTC
jgi:hypothetical protein